MIVKRGITTLNFTESEMDTIRKTHKIFEECASNIRDCEKEGQEWELGISDGDEYLIYTIFDLIRTYF